MTLLNNLRQVEKLSKEFRHLDETVYILIQGLEDNKDQIVKNQIREIKKEIKSSIHDKLRTSNNNVGPKTNFNSTEREIIKKYQKKVQ